MAICILCLEHCSSCCNDAANSVSSKKSHSISLCVHCVNGVVQYTSECATAYGVNHCWLTCTCHVRVILWRIYTSCTRAGRWHRYSLSIIVIVHYDDHILCNVVIVTECRLILVKEVMIILGSLLWDWWDCLSRGIHCQWKPIMTMLYTYNTYIIQV